MIMNLPEECSAAVASDPAVVKVFRRDVSWREKEIKNVQTLQ